MELDDRITAGGLYSRILELFDGRASDDATDGSGRLADLATCACFHAARGDWERAAEALGRLGEEDAAEYEGRWRALAQEVRARVSEGSPRSPS
jgi:hypothetical protein